MITQNMSLEDLLCKYTHQYYRHKSVFQLGRQPPHNECEEGETKTRQAVALTTTDLTHPFPFPLPLPLTLTLLHLSPAFVWQSLGVFCLWGRLIECTSSSASRTHMKKKKKEKYNQARKVAQHHHHQLTCNPTGTLLAKSMHSSQ